MNGNFIFYKDIENESVKEQFKMIKVKNSRLYSFLLDNLHISSSMSISEEVLNFLSNTADRFGSEQVILHAIVRIACNTKVSVAYLEWLEKNINIVSEKIKPEDLFITVEAAIEQDMPCDKFALIIEQENSVIEVLSKISDYEPAKAIKEEITSVNVIEMNTDIVEKNQTEQAQNSSDKGYVEMFDNLLSVMGTKDMSKSDIVSATQQNLNSIIAKFQVAISELNSYSSEVVHFVENSQEEIKRLNGMLLIYQKFIEKQQITINEQRGEIIHLQTRIQKATKMELKQEQLAQKIHELQNLTNLSGMQGNYYIED